MTSKSNEISGIALNVTRTRITVLVFNLSIIAFMLSIMVSRKMAPDYNAMAHLTATIALFVGFCLTLLGIFWLLSSQDWDAVGLSRPWSFTLGAITSHLALSQTITAFMHEYLVSVGTAISGSQPVVEGSNQALIHSTGLDNSALLILFIIGGLLWILFTYVAPLGNLIKSPVCKEQRWLFALYYVALQTPIYWLYASAWRVAYLPADQPANMAKLFALQFVQPLLWFR